MYLRNSALICIFFLQISLENQYSDWTDLGWNFFLTMGIHFVFIRRMLFCVFILSQDSKKWFKGSVVAIPRKPGDHIDHVLACAGDFNVYHSGYILKQLLG